MILFSTPLLVVISATDGRHPGRVTTVISTPTIMISATTVTTTGIAA